MLRAVNNVGGIVIAFAYVIAIASGCNMYSQSTEQIEINIERLREAQSKLLKDPSDKTSLSVILNLLSDGNRINRSNAAAVLGELGPSAGEQIKDKAVPALIALLDKGDEFDKYASACALKGFGPHASAAVPLLRKNLIPSDNGTARCSAEALGTMREFASEAVPDLVKSIKDNVGTCDGYFSSFCKSFITALGQIGPTAKSTTPDLEALLNHKDPYVKMRLAIALIRIDPANKQALREVEALLKAKDGELRRRTIWELKDIGREAAPAKKLIKMSTGDLDPDVSAAASELLHALENP